MKQFLSILLLLGIALGSTASADTKKPILLVLSNHGELGESGAQTGFYLPEAAHPWEVFREAGYPVALASPAGGFAPIDPKSFQLDDAASKAFWEKFGTEKNGRNGVAETVKLATVDPAAYSAVFYAGGHGAMWDFPDDEGVKKITAAIYEQGGAVGAVCHGPAALVNVELSDGTPLIKGKEVAPFTDQEEAAVGLTDTVPFLLASEMQSTGAKLNQAPNFQSNAVRDGRLVTGQNPASATETARLLIEALQAD